MRYCVFTRWAKAGQDRKRFPIIPQLSNHSCNITNIHSFYVSLSIHQINLIKLKSYIVCPPIEGYTTHPQLVELYHKFLSWEPKPELASYHIAFIKQYLTLLVYYQEHRTCRVPERVNKTLFHWIQNQKTYLRLYYQNKTEKGRFHIDDRYVKYLTKLGLGKPKKF